MEEAISVDVKNGVEARAGPVEGDHWSQLVSLIILVTDAENFFMIFCTNQSTQP